MNILKEKLKDNEAVNGCWLNTGSAINAEIVGQAGFDWALIDLEHGVFTEEKLPSLLQALNGSDTVPLVRVEGLIRQRAGRVLDMGVGGLMFPQIQDAKEAREVVSFMKYPPEGKRGMAIMVRATGFGKGFKDYYENGKDHVLGIVQIETPGALDQIDEIASTDGVDVLFVGPSDLTLSMGIFRQFDHPDYLAALEKVGHAARKAGKAAGILMGNPAEYGKYYDLGFRMLGCGSDSVFVSEGASRLLEQMRQ